MKNKKLVKIVIVCLFLVVSTLLIIGFSHSEFNILSIFSEKKSSIPEGVRKKYNFNYDWKFSLGEGKYNSGSTYKYYCMQENSVIDYNNCIDAKVSPGSNYVQVINRTIISDTDSPYSTSYVLGTNWTDVSLAHTFNDIDTLNNFTEAGMNGERSQYTGTSWYKKNFFVPESYSGKKIYIEFESARQAAEIYVNGVKLEGKYLNGFIPFGYDLTPYLEYNATNQITVMVDNSFPYYLEGNSVIPWHNPHWHPNFGGLYRNSYLYIMDSLHLTLPLYSFMESVGTYVYTSNEDGDNKTAIIHVDAEVENNRSESQTFTVKSTIYNMNNEPVLELISDPVTLDSNAKTVVQMSNTLTNAVRWSTDYPYLYTAQTEIIQNNATVDNNEIKFGIRTYRFTNDYGFYLNENYVELNGWGQKSTMEYAGLGSAYPDWMTDSFIKQMKDAGGNYIRWGHVAGSAKQIESADKYGILVTQPGVDSEGLYETSDYSIAALKLRTEAFRDLIIYFRNNPSIIMWELGNNYTSTNISLSAEVISTIKGLEGFSEPETLAALLYYITNTYDYGNRTTASAGTIANAGTYLNSTSQSERILTVRKGDTTIKNYVEVAETTDAQSGSGMTTETLGQKPSVEGEYNRYESRRGIWNTITNPSFTPQNNYHMTSEDFSLSQVRSFNTVISMTSSTGGANWIYSDSTSHGRVNTEISRVSGEVDATFLPKEAYYTDKVIFSDAPSSYILGHWNYSAGTTKTIYVIAKGATTLKLYVNSTEYTGTLSDKYIWTFNNVVWESGTISVKGYDATNNEIASLASSKTTHGEPAKLKMTMVNNPSGIKANGSDIVLVDVEVVDSLGNRCLTYDGETLNDLITFSLTGDTNKFIWRGGYNSGIEGSTNLNTLYAEAGVTRVAIKTTMNNGTVNLNAVTTSGLTVDAPLAITSNEVSNSDGALTGVSDLSVTSPYSLTSLTDPDYGDGSKLGLTTYETVSNASVLIESLTYTGTSNDGNGIADALSVGKRMYSDEAITFTNIPYKYLNSEYLLLPSMDANNLSADQINFVAKRDIDVYVLMDPRVTLPPTMADFTLISDTIIGGNGVEYNLYKKQITKLNSFSLSGTVDNVNDLNDGASHIIIFKETSKINDSIFFNENFTDFNVDSIYSGWNAVAAAGNSITADSLLNGDTLRFIDTNTDIAYVQKSFSSLKKFKVRYKAYVKDTANSNRWLRIWLTSESIIGQDDKAHLAVETYIDSNSSGVFVTGRAIKNGVPSTSADQLITGLNYNEWNDYEIQVDAEAHTYKVSVNGIEGSQIMPFNSSSINSISNIVIGTWVGGNSDYYIDDVEIIPLVDSVIENVKVDGESLLTFNDNTFSYNVSNLSSTSIITFDEKPYFKSSTQNYDTETGILTLTVIDYFNNEWIYAFTNSLDDPIFEGWTLYKNGLTIDPDVIDGETSIHFLDNSSSEMARIERTINPTTSHYSVSFDFYVPSDGYSDLWNRVFLTNGSQISVSDKSNVAIESYFQKTTGGVNAAWRVSKYETAHYGENIYSQAQWHNYKLVIDETTSTYNIYIDDELQSENTAFWRSVPDINTLVIGTGNASNASIYIKNYEFEDIYPIPIEGINYLGTPVANFDKDVYEYTIYAEDLMDEDTVITVNEGLLSSGYTITKDIDNQSFVVLITDPNGTEYTYTVNVLLMTERPITYAELQELISSIEEYTASYTARSWSEVETYRDVCNTYTEDTPQADISLCYYNLERSLAGLVQMYSTDDKSSLINIVNMSEDLINNYNFVKVLENNNKVYKNNNDWSFRSVPKEFQNANYFSFTKNIASLTGEVNLTAKRDITMLILKDRNAGSVVSDGYTDTGKIVTSTDGTNTVVYKVYSKEYLEGSIVVIDTKTMLTNRITEYPNIIAIKGTDEINTFMADTTSDYNVLSDFLNTWELYTADSTNNPLNNVQALEEKSSHFAIMLESKAGSASARSMSEISRQFAKQYGKFTISYYVYVDTLMGYNNDYMRIWVTNSSPSTWETGTQDVKTNVFVESYLGLSDTPSLNTYGLVYRYSTSNGSAGAKKNLITALNKEVWTEKIEYIVDMRNHTFDVKLGGVTVKTGLKFLQSNFEYADYLLFGTRATNTSKYWFRDIEISPIEEEIIGGLSVNSDEINYTSATKDYLYSSNDLSTKVVDVNTTANNYGSHTNITDTEYENISALDSTGDIALDHRIYYELTSNRLGLTTSIETALDKIKSKYTTSSWDNLEISLEAALLVLENEEETQANIDIAKTNLDIAIANLVLKSSSGKKYNGSISIGKRYINTASTNPGITNDSSITFSASLNTTVGIPYSYEETEHVRSLISNVAFSSGTKITMIDKSNDTPKYYYYEVSAMDESDLKKNYLLSDFIKMAGTSNYQNTAYYDGVTGKINESFDFIIDFSESTTKLSNGEYILKMEAVVGDETRDMLPKIYTISDQMGSTFFSVSSGVESMRKEDDVNLSLSASRTNGIYETKEIINSNREGTELGVRFTLWNAEDTIQLNLPENTTITYGDIICKVRNNSCILPLNNSNNSGEVEVNLNFGANTTLEDGNYQLKAELFRSYDGVTFTSSLSSSTVQMIVNSIEDVGMKVTLDTLNTNVIKQGRPYTLLYEINKSNANDANIVVSIYKKDGNSYIIDNLANYINDSLTTFDTNKYSLGNVSYWEPSLSSSIERGTYRINFDLYRNNVLETTIHKYFIIK